MPVYRVKKNKNYTVMSNVHLRDKRLSLKARGLLSFMLSLPDTWDYSEEGLVKETGAKISTLRSGLDELEKYGYLVRERVRAKNGTLGGTIYIIHEVPVSVDSPESEKPTLDNPKLDNLALVNPILENQTQQNTKAASTDITSTDSIYPSISCHEIDRSIDASSAQKVYDAYEQMVRENVGYELFARAQSRLDEQLETDEVSLEEYDEKQREISLATVDQIINSMLSIIVSPSIEPVTINGRSIPVDVVKAKLFKVGYPAFKACVRELGTNPGIRNPRSYALSMLYNS